jgi:hypothetical protein
MKKAAQLFASTMQHDPQVGFGNFHVAADFPAGILFHLIHRERLRNPRWQQTKCRFQRRTKLIEFHPPIRPETLSCRFMDPEHRFFDARRSVFRRLRIVRNAPLATPSAEMIADFVPEDTYQPGALGRSTREAILRFERREKCFLHDIFGVTCVAKLP